MNVENYNYYILAKVLPDASDDFTRISLVELPANQPPGSEPESTPTEAKPLSAKASKDKEKETKTPDPEEDESHKRRSAFFPFCIISNVCYSFHLFPFLF